MRLPVPSARAKSQPMDEFSLIDALVAAMGDATRGEFVVVGPGDDASITVVPPGMQIVTSVDALVAGVHFPADAPGRLVGRRALGVSVSDLAAMGATPSHVVVAATLMEDDEEWLLDFAGGIAAAARSMQVAVAGGNLARGPRNVAVTALGFVPEGGALLRSGARAGDAIFVSGVIGGAALGLAQLASLATTDVEELSASSPQHPLVRYFLPQPRLALGVALRNVASAAIDVSDGLLADLGHVCRASGVGARLELDAIPIATDAKREVALSAGDDYELLFTVPGDRTRALDRLPLDVAVTRIGEIVTQPGVTVWQGGVEIDMKTRGYRHFS